MPNFKKNTSPAMKRSGFKMKGYSYPGTSPMKDEKEFEDVVSETSPGPGYKKITGTNIWEHIPSKEKRRKERESTKQIAKAAGWKVNTLGEVTGKI